MILLNPVSPLPGYHYDGVVTCDSVLPVCDRVRDLTMTHSTHAHWHTVAHTSCIMLDLTPHLLYPAKAKERKKIKIMAAFLKNF